MFLSVAPSAYLLFYYQLFSFPFVAGFYVNYGLTIQFSLSYTFSRWSWNNASFSLLMISFGKILDGVSATYETMSIRGFYRDLIVRVLLTLVWCRKESKDKKRNMTIGTQMWAILLLIFLFYINTVNILKTNSLIRLSPRSWSRWCYLSLFESSWSF